MSTPSYLARLKAAPFDYAAYAVLCALAIIALFTFRDYGLGWDDFAHSQYGEMLYSYYASGFTDKRAFDFVNLYYYGGGFDIVATALGKLLPLAMFDTRRLLGAIVGLLGMVAVWRTGRRLAGPLAGLIALILIATDPTYYGHMFINAKDTPFAAAMMFLVFSLLLAIDEYPKPRVSTVLIFALALGLTIGTRIIGGVAAGFVVIAFPFLFVGEWREIGFRPALSRALGFCGRLALGLPLSYIIMGLIWPWSVQEPANPLLAIEYFSHFWERPWREMYDGALVVITNMPRTYLPELYLLKLPEIFTALSLAGAAGAIVASVLGLVSPKRRAGLMLVVSAALLPVILAVVTKPVLYNGIRHFLFIGPALAVLGGLAGSYLFQRLELRKPAFAATAAAVFLALIGWTTVDLVRIHPYEYTFFNHSAGGMPIAGKRYMTDYWGLGIKEAAEGLVKRLKHDHVPLPPDGKWRVVVCGPSTTASVELGPHFVASYDAPGADFAISLGTFYCAHLDAPVLAEAQREGIVFARAYDIRGRSYATTWVPEPSWMKNLAAAGKPTTFWH